MAATPPPTMPTTIMTSLSDGGGGWSQRWFVATSAAQLMVYRDVGSKECETIELADIVRVEL